MNPSISLLQNLENKLKQANIRSPYLSAFIGRSRNRIDLKDLDLLSNEQTSVSQILISSLMDIEKQGVFSLELSTASFPLAKSTTEERFQMDVLFKRLQSCYFDTEEDFAEHGTKSFGLGYPLLTLQSKQDKTRIIAAPVFIWYLDLKPHTHNHHAYTLSRKEESPIILNPQLINFLSNDHGVKLPGLQEDFLEDDVLCWNEIEEMIRKIKEIIPLEKVNFEEGICKIEDKAFYGRFLQNDTALLFNSGILSQFKSNKESIIQDYQNLISGYNDMLFDDKQLYQPYQADHFAAVPLDPSQENILRNISEHKKVIIQGPPGTGKSNSLSGIILNALENKAKVLVVCEKKTALEVIYENLKEKGIDSFCAVIDNVNADRQKIVKSIRDKIENKTYDLPPVSGLNAYINNKQQFGIHHENIIKKYSNLLQPILGDMSWKEVIGHYLESKRKAKNNALQDLKIDPISFDQATYFSLQDTIKQAALLRSEIHELYAVFKPLDAELFKENWSTSALQDFKNEILDYIKNSQILFEKWEGILQKYTTIQSAVKPGFIKQITALFHSGLRKEIQYNKNIVKESQALFDKLSTILNGISKENPLEKMPLLTNDIIKQLQPIATHFDSFRTYFKWRHFYINTKNPAFQTLLDALEGTSTEQWEETSKKWYLNQVLMAFEMNLGSFPTDEFELNNLHELGNNITQFQPHAIHSVLNAALKEQLKNRTLQSLRILFNLRGNKTFTNRTSLRTLFHQEFELMTAFFPVLLINPAVCSSMLPLQSGIFDLVIFDEASQLKLEDTYPALLRGRFKVISGDIHQMPPATHFSSASSPSNPIEDIEEDVVYAEEESLLTYAQNADFEFNYLDFHYRSQNPLLIAFSNAAFYGNRLVAMPISSHEKPIQFRQILGIYEDNKNEKEADAIIEILSNEIQADEKGVFPSVGIATFNMTQQRFIQEKLWEKADQEESFRTRLSQLESAGLFVKNLENIQGDERDIILISTTFGRKADGSFIQNFGPINREGGYKMLNVIVTRAKKQVYVISSIPKEFYSNYKDDIITKGNTGKGIFYAYLNFAEACQAKNEIAVNEILDFLADNSSDNAQSKSEISAANFLTESVFEEEVIEALLEHIPANRIITQFKLGGFRLDIVILNTENEPCVVIECDGKTYHKSAVAHRYDLHRQQILERYGLHVHRIWSTNWWRNSKQEVSNTLDFIKKHTTF